MAQALRWRAQNQPDRLAYNFLTDGEDQEARITYSELDARARAVARFLESCGARSERVLLLYPPGLDYIAALFGCLYAGAIAVPAYPPGPGRITRALPRLQAIVSDCEPSVVLTTASILAMMPRLLAATPHLGGLHWMAADTLPPVAPDGLDFDPEPGSLAFLQYTSGSTATPKGVMVGHANITANQRMIAQAFGSSPNEVGMGWLPFYHDMGLIGNVFHPAFAGYPMVLMSPLSFLQKPLRWLRAIAKHRATVSGGPNFAYDLCVDRIKPEQRASLDLSRWTTAFNGAEPVRADTFERFAAAFAPSGFQREAFHPCYGLAEATLMATGGPLRRGPVLRQPADGGTHGRRPLVSCGSVLGDERLLIVDPETMVPCAAGEVGEIWLAGSNIAGGYWRRSEETERTFRARPVGDDGAYMRTGDLGIAEDGELYVTGRIKDVVIVRGRNLYPQDVELSVEGAHPALRVGCAAAFAVTQTDNEEQLGIAAEIGKTHGNGDLDAICKAIVATVTAEHEVAPLVVALMPRGGLPRTSSGKLRRQALRAAVADGTIEAIHVWRDGAADMAAPPAAVVADTPPLAEAAPAAQASRAALDNLDPPARERAVRTFLLDWLSQRLNVLPQSIDCAAALSTYGLGSRDAVTFAGAIEDWIGLRISPTAAYEYPTVDRLVTHLVAIGAPAAAPLPSASPPCGVPLASDEPIAIVGLGCRVPGAENPEALWQLLACGGDAIADIPTERLDLASIYDPEPSRGRSYVRRAAMLPRVDGFDAGFFDISGSEAASLDPQQRLLLEVTWEALEDAGVAPQSLSGSMAGVFVGISTGDYADRLARSVRPELIDVFSGTGTARSTAAGRLSYRLGTHGPAMVVDTACSSSLVAVHLGCQSLRNGESDMVIAGGVSLILAPESFVFLSQLRALAPDGTCKTFDADADGYGRGEGCAIVVLKRMRDALAAGDTIQAVIHGSAVNQDGATNGLTAPSGAAQQAVIRAALARGGASPRQIDYVEAHGTGTPLGDLIELEALGAVMGTERTTPLRIGAVKTNIGHLEAAAGVVGLVKTVLALQHEAIPPHIHMRQPSPRFAWDAARIEVPREAVAWPRGERPRLAGVSSFGLSGTNAHVIVGEAPAALPSRTRAARPATILAWSASSPEALAEMGTRLSDWIAAHPDVPPTDIAASLAHARTGLRYRAAVVGDSAEDLAAQLAKPPAGRATEGTPSNARPRIGFLFSGQGSHYLSMGAELDRCEAPFRDALDRCAAVLDQRLSHPLRELLFDKTTATRLRETRFTQPVLFSLQYALAAQWRAWGIEPVAVMGHSVGEIAAASVAGVLPLEDALVLVAERGRLIDVHCQRGAMISAAATEEQVRAAIAARGASSTVSIAALNAPELVVFSGDEKHVLGIAEELSSAGVWVRRLDVSHAFHSPHMEAALAAFAETAAQVTHSPANIAFASTVSGQVLGPQGVDAHYWVRQMREPVRFAEATHALAALDLDALVEIGPQATLLAIHRHADPDSDVPRLASLDRNGADCKRMLGSLAELFMRGADVRWNEVVGPRPRPAPRLPTYPFQRKRYWLDETPVADLPRHAGNGATAPIAMPQAASRPAGRAMIMRRLREIVGDLLRQPPDHIDERAPLIDMGADSIIVIDGLQRVQQEMGVRIPLREVWNGLGTIEGIADYIVRARGAAAAPPPPRSSANGNGHAVTPMNGVTPVVVPPASALTARQRAHIAALADRYTARTAASKRRKSGSHPYLADVRAAAGYRAGLPAAQWQAWLAAKEIAYPIVGARAEGARIWDIDGNDYVDFTMGFGVHLFGHRAPFLVEALEDELRRGAQIGPQSERAAEAAALIRELTGVERLTFCVTGTEAVMAAVRLARARVKRPCIAAFAGSYHGSYDGVLPVIPLTHGVPASVDTDTLVLEYGNPRSLEIIEARAAELSAVLVEPVQSRRPDLQPREFLQALREITARHGIALIFDEVLVGFRIAQGGAQAHFGVQADLVTYGKIVGGGLPVGVVAGRADYLDAVDGGAWSYGDASAPQTEAVWLAGTFNKNPLAMASAVAALRHLRDQGPGLQEALNRKTAQAVQMLRDEFTQAGAPIEPVHFGSLMRLHMPRTLDLLYSHLIEQGIYVWEGRSMFLSTAHSDGDVARLVGAVRSSLAQLKEGGFLTEPERSVPRKPRGAHGDNGAAPQGTEKPLLFCFPYAGGSAVAFHHWGPRLGEAAEVVPVHLPGRDSHVSENLVTDFATLVDILASEIAARLGAAPPAFALFGHSMGALLAYGVARKLMSRGLVPAALLVSGEPAPHVARPEPERAAHLLSDADLIDAMASHGAPIDQRISGLIAEELAVLRADLALCHSFRPADAEPLDCRIVAFAGQADPLASKADVAAWAQHACTSFALHVLPGDHFFIRSERDALLDLIAMDLGGDIRHALRSGAPAQLGPPETPAHA